MTTVPYARPSSPRLVSLDILRGLTVMLMIFVNNGAGNQIFATLQHSKWNGLTLCDLVFPFFLFMVGVSTYLSLGRRGFEWSWQTAWRIGRRTATLFLIGLAINWFDMACDGRPADFAHLRIMGVMQRIALCYGCTALAAVGLTRLVGSMRALAYLAGALLMSYTMLIVIGGGYNYDAATNFIAIADAHLLGHAHLYHKAPVDPEGVLSTLPAIAHTMIGLLVAQKALGHKGGDTATHTAESMRWFAMMGVVLIPIGIVLAFVMPLNKRIWSPSYVLLTCGLASMAQAALVWLVDLRPGTPRSTPSPFGGAWGGALIFGTNPLLLYLASEVIAIVFGATGIKDTLYGALHAVIPNGYWASVAYATLFTLGHAALGYPLWKRRIYIKI